ncbi:hypothetical protein SPSINT_2214 [Staphylococcus pseudintermedius HKU10-03]|nr:hypothetical protein SPSINT_2214 [Staphylococcus pseudintermedius HKU10-03]
MTYESTRKLLIKNIQRISLYKKVFKMIWILRWYTCVI